MAVRHGAADAEPVDDAEPPPPPALGVAFTGVAFLHWPYPAKEIEPLQPPDVTPDTFAGAAYVREPDPGGPVLRGWFVP